MMRDFVLDFMEENVHRGRWDTFVTSRNVKNILEHYRKIMDSSAANISMKRSSCAETLTLTLKQNARNSCGRIISEPFLNLEDLEGIRKIVMKNLERRKVEIVSTRINDPENDTTIHRLSITKVKWQ